LGTPLGERFLFIRGPAPAKLGTPLGERFLFITGPAPASGRPKPGKDTLAHMPEKSGMDGALCPPLLACPQAGTVAAAATNVTAKRKLRPCIFVLPSSN